MSIIIWIVVGALAGWIAGLIMKGAGFGLLVNIIVGIVGGLLGGWLLGLCGLTLGGGFVGSLITSVIGAVVLLFILSFFKKK
jgi:uncharacterized membrane protein YeaQ/YmgE (transglycosylase-associated protein family)